jgi:hypothetical protein
MREALDFLIGGVLWLVAIAMFMALSIALAAGIAWAVGRVTPSQHPIIVHCASPCEVSP